MKKIKEKLIHLLGGHTEEEKHQLMKKCVHRAYGRGYHMAFFQMNCFIQSIHGLPAGDWCKNVCEYVEQKLNKQ